MHLWHQLFWHQLFGIANVLSPTFHLCMHGSDVSSGSGCWKRRSINNSALNG